MDDCIATETNLYAIVACSTPLARIGRGGYLAIRRMGLHPSLTRQVDDLLGLANVWPGRWSSAPRRTSPRRSFLSPAPDPHLVSESVSGPTPKTSPAPAPPRPPRPAEAPNILSRISCRAGLPSTDHHARSRTPTPAATGFGCRTQRHCGVSDRWHTDYPYRDD